MSFAVLGCCLLFAAPQGPAETRGAAAAPAARVLRYVSIRELIAPAPAPLIPPLGSFLGRIPGSDVTPRFLLGELENRGGILAPLAVVDLLRLLSPIDIDQTPELHLQVAGSTLVVAGPPDQVHLVETAAHDLARAMVHRIRLGAALYRVTAPPSGSAVATRERLDALRAGAQPVWEATAIATSGSLASLANERGTAYVADIEVEVAQEAKIGDPQTRELFEGVSVVVEPHALTESRDLVLYCQFAFGEQRGPIASRGTAEALPSIDVPRVDGTSGAMSGRVPDGGALLLAVHGDGAGNLVLAVTASHEPSAKPAEDLGIYPVSALLSGALRTPVANVDSLDEWAHQAVLRTESARDTHLGPRDPSELQELLTLALGDLGAAQVQVAGGHLCIKGTAEQRQAAARVVRGLQDQGLATVLVELRTMLEPAQGGDGVFAAGAAAPAGAPSVLRAIALPALIGRSHIVVSGQETTVVFDADVEIAQKSSISNPVVATAFDGAIASLYAYPLPEGIGVETSIDVLSARPAERRAAENRDDSDLWLPQSGRARFTHAGALAPGQDVLLGTGPTVQIGDRSYRTRQVLRITAP